MKRTVGTQGKGPKVRRRRTVTLPQDLEIGQNSTKEGYTEQELLDMKPAKDASPEAWRAWHQLLYDAGLLRPPEAVK